MTGGKADWIEELRSELAGRYTIERELARGAMARVYVARDHARNQRVALKALPPELASATNAERFQREIKIAGELAHPNILPLIDFGAEGRYYWYTMPLVEEESLRSRLGRGPLSPNDVGDLAAQAGSALAHAHERGVVHRDLKPENLMCPAGRWVVLDFGLARALESDGRITGVNMPLGTPAYMSPEQILGASKVDARSDIYGFGCVLYEAATGRPPFGATTVVQLLKAHMAETPPAPSTIRPGLSPALDGAILKSLAKDPAARQQTVMELVAGLRGAGDEKTPPKAGFLGRLFGRSNG